MSLKIKNPKKFVFAAIVAILLIIFELVGFFTIIGKIAVFFAPKEEPQATQAPTVTAQNASPNTTTAPTAVAPTTDTSTLSSLTVLVNKNNELPSDYVPTDLVTVSDVSGVELRGSRTTQMRKEAADALAKLFDAADKDGVSLFCASGYRDYATQKDVYAQNVSQYGEEQADLVSAKPGQSEHQTGLVMDVTCEELGMDLQVSFYDTPEGQWIANNAQKYGFIIRFLKDKTDITGYSYEPWHIRYVGIDTAKEIYDKNQTLEEYLGKTD